MTLKEPRVEKNRFREQLISILLVLLVFTALVAFVSYRSRESIRQQVLNRDADVIHLLTEMGRPILNQGKFSGVLPVWMMGGTVQDSNSPATEIKGIVAVQLVNIQGGIMMTIPGNYIPARLSAADFVLLKKKKSISRFHSKIRLDSLFVDPEFILDERPVPLLELIVPLQNLNQFEGAIQIWLDGKSMSRELTLLDQNIMVQSGVVLICGYFIISMVLLWAFHRLQKINQVLYDRTLKLRDANRELVLAAKSSALGAISAHLIHGLKNPLAGLQEFVANQSQPDLLSESEMETEWHTARETTRRMTQMLHEIVQIMREESDTGAYEITVAEIDEVLHNHVADLSKQQDVDLESILEVDYPFNNREGNLIILILENLVKNAIEATPAGGKTILQVQQQDKHIQFLVKDEGEGLPKDRVENPFLPCISSKPGGNGIGLAISYQLARHMGAKLTLDQTHFKGSCFVLTVGV